MSFFSSFSWLFLMNAAEEVLQYRVTRFMTGGRGVTVVLEVQLPSSGMDSQVASSFEMWYDVI